MATSGLLGTSKNVQEGLFLPTRERSEGQRSGLGHTEIILLWPTRDDGLHFERVDV